MARIKEDYRSLTGPQKAAMLMLSLPETQATKLISGMEDDEIKELSQTMSNLGSVSANLMERVFVDFADAISNTGSLVGSYSTTERLLMKSLDKDRVNLIMEEIRGPAGRTMWDKLGNVHEQVLANYLKNEYPQTVAVVLTKHSPRSASTCAGIPGRVVRPGKRSPKITKTQWRRLTCSSSRRLASSYCTASQFFT